MTALPPRRRYPHDAPGHQMLFPSSAELPKSARSANDRARELLDAYVQAEHALGEAEQAVKATPVSDPDRGAALADARRERDLAKEAAFAGLFDLRDAVLESRGDLVEARHAAISEERERAARLLDELRDVSERLQFERDLLAAIERVHVAIDSLDFRAHDPASPGPQRRRAKVEQIERERPQVPSASTRELVPRELDHLLAALAVKLEEEAGETAASEEVVSGVVKGREGDTG